MDQYLVAIILTTVGFFALAALLLIPVWRFLQREEEIAAYWTDDTVGELSEAIPETSPDVSEDEQPLKAR